MAQASRRHSTSATSVYHTGRSSGNSITTSPSSSLYHSERIQRMIENRRNFRSEVESDIENSRVHWSVLTNPGSISTDLSNLEQFEVLKKHRQWEGFFKFIEMVTLGKKINEVGTGKDTCKNINEVYTDRDTDRDTESDTDSASTRLTDRQHFEVLKNHPEWGGFFKDVKVVLGQKINEGAQAEIYDAQVEFSDGREFGYGYHVVKLMKGDRPLQEFQRQWPVGMLCNVSKDTDKGPLMWIKGGTLIDNRFGFVMVKQWGDLRKLIDLNKQLSNNNGPPFQNVGFMKRIMLCIARDMDRLHEQYGIVHRDLKASNVLLWSIGEELPDNNRDVKATVVDYECSIGVVGTGFWRAPEILQQLKNRSPSSRLLISKMSDVYSYGMTCYEILTGCIPFEGNSAKDYDFILQGNRPGLPIADTFDHYCITEIIEYCWKHEPSDRPTFSEIVRMLEADQHQFNVSNKREERKREEHEEEICPR